MKRVTSIGGIFFKSKNPEATKKWYANHLGLETDNWGTNFEWRQAEHPDRKGFTQWSAMDCENNSHIPEDAHFMINYRVENLEWLVKQLHEEGVTIIDEIETYDYGKFIHILDNEGNKVELWEPFDENYDRIVEGRTK